MDLGITQKEAARRIGADQWTVINWERRRTQPAVRFVPAVIRFLGYDPFPKGETLGERLRAAHRARGLSHTALASELQVDPSTILGWERGQHAPTRKSLDRLSHIVREALTLLLSHASA